MNIYVTGVSGFLGSWVAEHFVNEGHSVFGCDSLIGGDASNVPDGITWYEMDILNTSALAEQFKEHKIDIVYHCAALAYEGLSVFSPALVTQNILAGTTSVQSAAIQAGVDLFVQCSSMARYGALKAPFNEEMQCLPVDPYGIAKNAADECLKSLGRVHGLPYVICVPHNIVGPRQRYYDPFRNVLSIFANRILLGKPLIIYGDGSQKRCFSHIKDVLSCLTGVVDNKECLGQVINIGPDEHTVTLLDAAKSMCNVAGVPFDPIFMPSRPLEVHDAHCSSDKARRLLRYKTQHFLTDCLVDILDYVKEVGPREFQYHLPIEILNDKTPKTWSERLM